MLPPDPPAPNDVDDLLRRYWAGEKQLEGPIYEALIPPMRRIAQRQLAEHAKNYAMVQKTMIAIDTIQKLLRQDEPVQNREHALRLGKRFTAWIIETYHRKERLREAGELPASSHDQHPPEPPPPAIHPLDMLECFQRLEKVSRRAADVFRLRWISGCTIDETADALDVGHATVERQFKFALDFMVQGLNGHAPRGDSTAAP